MLNKQNNKIIKVLIFIIVIALTIVILHNIILKNSYKTSSEAVKVENVTREVIDMDGNTVTIPEKVNKVGTSWPGFCNVLFTVGGDKKMAAAPAQLKKYPWSVKIFPDIQNIAYPFESKVNLEELIQSKTDVVFLRKGDEIDKVKEAGIPVVMIDYTHNNIQDVINGVMLAGKVLGDEEYKKAEEYKEYFNEKIDTISAITSKIPENEKPRVIYLSVSGETSVWGSNMPQDEAIKIAGGINAAKDDIDGYKEVSIEQLLKWDPDVIIAEGDINQSKIIQNAGWQQLKAVKNNNVLASPSGVFSWARLGSESAIQLPWLAKTLYKDKFKEIDMNKETKYFYKTFFDYDLQDDELSKILNGKNPK